MTIGESLNTKITLNISLLLFSIVEILFMEILAKKDITYLLKDEKLLINTALEGITSFKDNNGKYISLVEFFSLNIKEIQSSKSKIRTLINNKLDKIISFISSIPTYYKDILIMSDQRKAYYIAALKIRVEKLLNDRFN